MIAPESGRRPRSDVGALAAAGLLAATALLVVVRTWLATRVGPGWDAFAFLANAAEYAGRGFGYTEPQRSPLMSWLVALVFRTGIMDRSVIQWVDGALTALGLAAFFLLLRRRFAPLPSALAALALFVMPPVWAWTGVGYTDFPSVAVALVALLALITATERNPYVYLLAAPLALAAVMTRFTALLLLFPLAVWFALRVRLLRDFKFVAGGVAIAVLAYIPASAYYADRFGDRLFPFIISFQIASEQLTGRGFVTTEPGSPGRILLLIAGVLSLTAVAGLLQLLWERLSSPQGPSARRVAAVVAIAAAVMFVESNAGLIARQAVLCASTVAVYLLLARRDAHNRVIPNNALDATMLAWFLAAFDWYVHNPVQVPRYLIAFAPGLVYLVTLGLEAWSERLDLWLRGDERGVRVARMSLLAAIGIVIAVAVVSDFARVPRQADAASAAAERSAQWLAANDTALASKGPIYSDAWPYTSWYLRTNARPMPSFEDSRAPLHELEKSRAAYYLTFATPSFEPTFAPAANIDGMSVLSRTRTAERTLPRVRYLGDAWSNYLERITGYTFYLDADSGSQGWEGSAFLDAYSPEQLARYPVVAAYDFRWRSRAAAERALTTYVRSGGVLVIDASGNFARPGFALSDAGMFETAISRAEIARDARIAVSPEFSARHAEVATVSASPWVDETGEPWFGATYEPLATADDWRVVATVGGKPLVAVQTLGKGRIYWIGANLAWHAFKKDNAEEAALVSAVFEDARLFAEEGGRTR